MPEDDPDAQPIGEPAIFDEESSGDLVTVATFILLKDAFEARLTLESDGIECVLLDENIAGINPFYAVAGGGMRLQVRESDAARAREILAPEAPPAVAPPVCPKCGSNETARDDLARDSAWSLFVALIAIFPFHRPRWRCKACGNVWKQQ